MGCPSLVPGLFVELLVGVLLVFGSPGIRGYRGGIRCNLLCFLFLFLLSIYITVSVIVVRKVIATVIISRRLFLLICSHFMSLFMMERFCFSVIIWVTLLNYLLYLFIVSVIFFTLCEMFL